MKLDGAVAVITGSAANIGRAIAMAFVQRGCAVVITTRSNVEGAASTVAQITAAGGRAIFVQGDLSQQADVDRLFAETLSAFGRVDVLVNNAGGSQGRPFFETDRDYWVKVFDDNFFTTVACSRTAAAIMAQSDSGGIILNTSSMRGLENVGREGVMAYSAAKTAVISFTKTLAKELAPGVRVNCVSPGLIASPKQLARPAKIIEELLDASLIARWIQPEEIAHAFIYLAEADAVTGENLVVDGGFSLKLE